MSVLCRKLLRDLRAAPGLLLATAGILAVGVAAYTGCRAVHKSLAAARDDFYSACRMADFWIDLDRLPHGEVAALTALPGVAEVQPRLCFAATVDLESSPQPINGLVLSLPAAAKGGRTINTVLLRHGSGFASPGAAEVIVNEGFARRHGLKPGDRLPLLLHTRRHELLVAGVALASEFSYPISPSSPVPDPEHFGVFYLPEDFLAEATGFAGACNQLVGRLTPEIRSAPDAVLLQLEQQLDRHGVRAVTALREQSSHRFLSNEIRGLETFGLIIPCIFLAVAVLLLQVLSRRRAEQQRTIIGTLGALGYRNGQVLRHYLALGAVVGLAGAGLGCLLGQIVAMQITSVYRAIVELPPWETDFYPGDHLLGTAFGVAAALLGTFAGVRGILALTPAQAMRPPAPAAVRPLAIERWRRLWTRLSAGWRQVLRNLSRAPRRTLVAFLAAAASTALCVQALLIHEAVFFMVDHEFDHLWRGDVDLVFRGHHDDAVLYEASRLPAVEHAEPLLHVPCRCTRGERQVQATLTGLPTGARLTHLADAAGHAVRAPEHGLAVGRQFADVFEVRTGDTLTLQLLAGPRRTCTLQVVAIVETHVGLNCYLDRHALSRLLDESSAVNAVRFQLAPGAGVEAKFFRAVKELGGLAGVQVRRQALANLRNTLVKINGTYTVLLLVFAAILFLGATLNTALLNLAERRRESATLLVLGHTPRAVGRLFLREMLLVNLVGTVVGLPLGARLFAAVAAMYSTELFRIPVVAPGGAWLLALALAGLFTLLAYGVLRRQLGRLNCLDELKGHE